MALYRPKYRDPKTQESVHSQVWWMDIVFAGRRIRESTKCEKKTAAQEYLKNRKKDLENALAGIPVDTPLHRVRVVGEILATYLHGYELNHRPHSVACLRSAIKSLTAHFGKMLLIDLTEERVREYIRARQKAGVGGRTINLELGELSRAIGKPWKMLWPKLRKLEERHDVGRALTHDEERRLISAADKNRSPNLKTLLRVALLTGARAGELTSLRWGQIDLKDRCLIVGVSKTRKGTGRMIPLNEELFQILSAHAAWFTEQFGETAAHHCVFPFGSPYPCDPTRPTIEIKTAWSTVQKTARVKCRWHDLRHTAATKLAESAVSEETFKSLFGWMSSRLVERYSHVRVDAKRKAMESIRLAPSHADLFDAPQDSPKETMGLKVN